MIESSVAEPVPKTVFITGATGYLGRALIPALLARGHQIGRAHV